MAVAGIAHENPGRLVAARTHRRIRLRRLNEKLEDLQLVLKAGRRQAVAMDQLMRRYTGFVA